MNSEQPKNGANGASARKFFNWALTKGQPQAVSLDYVPLPANIGTDQQEARLCVRVIDLCSSHSGSVAMSPETTGCAQ